MSFAIKGHTYQLQADPSLHCTPVSFHTLIYTIEVSFSAMLFQTSLSDDQSSALLST